MQWQSAMWKQGAIRQEHHATLLGNVESRHPPPKQPHRARQSKLIARAPEITCFFPLIDFFKQEPSTATLKAGKLHSPPTLRPPMIEVHKLTKQFGSKLAVDELSFTVKKGEVLGFLGPNGAGKSTTMRMITGFIPPSSGDAKVCGLSITENPQEAKTKIGYLPESAPLYPDMTVSSFLSFCAEIRAPFNFAATSISSTSFQTGA